MAELGKLRVNKLLWIFLPTLFTIPLITYYIAVSKHQTDPFPFVTITSTACPYPQNILFRFGMLTATSFLTLIFFVVFKWLNFQVDRVKYPGKVNNWVYPIAQFSLVLYAITIGTIDSAGTGNLHGICAVGFFVILYLSTLYITFFLKDLRSWDTSVMGKQSWFLKRLTCWYLSIIWLYCVYNLIVENTGENKQDRFVVILEWNEVLVNLIWVFSFRNDWKDMYITLYDPTGPTNALIQQ